MPNARAGSGADTRDIWNLVRWLAESGGHGALGTGARLWLAMQQAHDLYKAEVALGAKVRAEVEPAA